MNRKTLHKISYGLYILSSRKKNKINGQIANALIQITSEPPTVAVSVNKKNLTHDYINDSKAFTISILNEKTPMIFIGKFGFKSGRDIDKFKDVNYNLGETKIPIVKDYCIAYFEAKVINRIDVGTHTIFVGEVIEGDIFSNENQMTYEYYHKVKGGISPKTAPTYTSEVDKIKIKEVRKMDKYVCTVCGFVYDPEKGYPEDGIEPGTKFEDIPDDWVCPVCGAGKDKFDKE